MKHFLLILIVCTSLVAYPQKKEYFVAFCGKQISFDSRAGHAFIAVGKGDPFTCSVDGDTETWGLYANEKKRTRENCKPSSLNALKSYFIGMLSGCLYSDVRTRADNVFIVRCNADIYFKVLLVIEEWKNKQYELKKQDCLTFIMAVAELFGSEISIPQRCGLDNFPNEYIVKLKKAN